MSNALGNTLTFRASRMQGGVTYYQDYTVTIRRTLSLDALRVSYAGAAMKMTPDYAASVTQYAVTAPMGARALTVQPVLRKRSLCPTARVKTDMRSRSPARSRTETAAILLR